MKTSLLKNMVVMGAVISAMGVIPAIASTQGVDSILEAAAGKPVAAPADNAAQPASSTVKSVPAVPEPAKSASPIPAATQPKIPSGMVVGPILKTPPVAANVTSSHPAIPSALPMSQQAPSVPIQSAPVTSMNQAAPNAAMPSPMPVSRPSAPISQSAPSLDSNQATAGYINPFLGSPGITQKLSSTLSILQLQTKIAKERAAYSKYNSEANTLAMDNSPQLRQLESDVSDLRGKVQSLSAQDARAEQVAQQVHAAAVKSHNHMEVIAIVNDQGDRSAIIKTGKKTDTVTVGSSVDGHLVQAVDPHQVVLADGKTLPLSQQIGEYRSTSWKGTQNNGEIAAPQQSDVLGRLASEAKQNGITFGAPPAHGGVTPDGMPPLNPGMLH